MRHGFAKRHPHDSRTIPRRGSSSATSPRCSAIRARFARAIDELVQPYAGVRIDKVAGIEARGFILGGAVAHQLSVGFVPVRKKGKLPCRCWARTTSSNTAPTAWKSTPMR